MLPLVLAAPLLGALAPALSLATAVPAAQLVASCSPGAHTRKVKGHSAISFCGPAKATVHVGTRTVHFSGGECRKVGRLFTVNIGTTIPGREFKGKKPDYFGITARKAQPGRQTSPAIAFITHGVGYALIEQSVTLARGLKSGRFVGRTLVKHAKVSGSFTC
jgi:hypothetical protein